MRHLFLVASMCLCAPMRAQIALDDLFITERWLLNAEASILEHHGVDHVMAREQAERIRTYALDEPNYWEKRVFLRLDPKDNPALVMEQAADSIIPFVDIVNQAIASGKATLWKDLDYIGSDTARYKEPVASTPIILKVDFHIDTVTMRAAPHIVGLSVERPGGGYAHFYYPELSWALRKYKVKTDQGLITTDAYFKEFRFKATWLGCAEVASAHACRPRQPSLEQQAELDALMELFLLERVLERDGVMRSGTQSVSVDLHPFGPVKARIVFDASGALAEMEIMQGEQLLSAMRFINGRPHGPYRAFYPDGRLREEGQFTDGLREGKWTSWFPNGSLRSQRAYGNGRLHGTQQVYFDSSKLWLEYGMHHGEYEGPHTTWYPDGGLKAAGTMHEGFIHGEWDYHIRIKPALMAHLDQYNATLYHLPDGSWQDGVISYHVTVTDTGEPGPMNSCMFGRCIQWAFSEVR